MRLNELTVKFVKPNFADEYEEALRYDELKDLSEEEWIDIAKTGKPIKFEKLNNVGNTTKNSIADAKEHWKEVEAEKKERFLKHKGPVEMPIVLKINQKYDLLSGNTRLTGCIINGIDPTVWLIELK